MHCSRSECLVLDRSSARVRLTKSETVPKERDEEQDNMRARRRLLAFRPAELFLKVVDAGRRVELESTSDVRLLLRGEEPRVSRRPRKDEEHDDAVECCEQALEVEDPPARSDESVVQYGDSGAIHAEQRRQRITAFGDLSLITYRHPSCPPLPSSLTIAAANRPEKAPAREAAEKKSEMRV